MSDVNVGAVDGVTVDGVAGKDVVFNHVVTTGAKRAKSVGSDEFFMTYARLAKADKTSQEIADELGMNLTSLVARASTLRASLKKENPPIELPYPKTVRGQGGKVSTKMNADALRKFLEGLNGSDNL